MQATSGINIRLLAVLILFPPLVCFGLDLPHASVIAVFVTVIGLWLSEAVPLPVTGLTVPLLATLYGALPAADAFDAFGNDLLFLFLGCFLMGRAMEKYGFDKRLAYFLLGRCMPGSSFLSLNIVMALASFVLSMWISNTSATAILSAVTLGVLNSLESKLPDEKIRERVSVRLLLSCAFAASIGGLATPVGSPPNLIAIKFLSQNGITISFVEWLLLALPICLVMLLIMLVIFSVCFPLRKLNFPGIKEQFRGLQKDLGRMSSGEIQVACVFMITICLWVFPGLLKSAWPDVPLLTILDSRFSMSVVGLLGGIVMFYLPVRTGNTIQPNLNWEETDRIEWGTLMLFGGGLTLGALLEQSGAAKDIAHYLFMGDISNPLLLCSAIVVCSILMSEFASNTAAASILIPLVLGATSARGTAPEITSAIVLAATFGASFGFMLPVSTPPNAIVYGTGKVPARDMRRAGIALDILGAIIIVLYMLLPLIYNGSQNY